MSPNFRRCLMTMVGDMRKLYVAHCIRFAFALLLATTLVCCSALSAAQTVSLHLQSSVPGATVGVAYNVGLSVTGGVAPYSFSLKIGSLPNGLALDATTGAISGTPTTSGTFNFGISVSDALGDAGDKRLSIRVVPVNSPTMTVSPSMTTVTAGGTQQFLATVSNTSKTAVTWSANSGSISSGGLFRAPSVSSSTIVSVTATLTASPATQATALVTVTPVTPPSPLTITTSSLPAGVDGTAYSAALAASGGTLPYSWSVSSGSLPSGIQLSQSGDFSGTAIQSGNFSLTATVADSAGQSVSQSFVLVMSPQTSGGNYDGPAELPRIFIQSTLADTPAPGGTVFVPAGGNLQTALNQANCGDTIQLQAGATYTGVYTFPAKACDDFHWIIVRTSAPDSSLPSEGTRLTPCYAGVSSLPARPPLNCTSTQNVMTKLVMGAVSGSGPIVFAPGATHYRLIGLEVTRPVGGLVIYNLASGPSGVADHIFFDRMWMHGTASDDTTRGVMLTGMSYVAVIDSSFTDFHCTALTGACTDSQAILGSIGQNPGTTYKIVNNFLEASGENILFGGGSASSTSADIEVRHNHMFKPLIWMKGQPGFVGGKGGNPFIVKNLFELKNAQRVLFEGNILENTWAGFSQVGFGILLTPQNQFSRKLMLNVCPICQVTDVTIRYSTISHVAAGFQIANPLVGYKGVGYIGPLAGERYSIHDVVVDDIDGPKYGGPGLFAQISTAPTGPTLNSVTINHVTAFSAQTMLMVGAQLGASKIANLTITNNILQAGQYPVWSTGGANNCAAKDIPVVTLSACFNPYTFSSNVIFATPGNFSATVWPGANTFPSSASSVGFVNYSNGNGGNYQLQPHSPFIGQASDGKNPGADIVAINQATNGAY